MGTLFSYSVHKREMRAYLTGKSDSLRLRKKSQRQSVNDSSSCMQLSSMVSRLAPPQIVDRRRDARRTLGKRDAMAAISRYK